MPSVRNSLNLMVVTALTLSLAFPALPQEPSQGPTLKATVNLVNLFATVRDKNKRIVGDLKQEDFKVYEDNVEQKIAFFSKEVTMPITLGLLIDTSGSEQNRLGAEQEAASRFLERVMKKGDEAMVISFDLDVDLLADFTDDRGQIERAINKARIGAVSGGVITPGTIPSNRAAPIFTMQYTWRATKSCRPKRAAKRWSLSPTRRTKAAACESKTPSKRLSGPTR